MAVASLVLGIIALVVSIFSGGSLGVVGIICGVLGLILGIVGRKDETKKGMATAGIVCSIIGLFLGLILLIACAACVGTAAAMY